MTEKLIYLASPYSSITGDHNVEIARFNEAVKCTQWLLERGYNVFSPIAYSHQFAEAGMKGDYEQWKRFDELMVEKCDELWVLNISGVFESKGVKAEIEHVKRRGHIIIRFVEPRDNGDYYDLFTEWDGIQFYEKILKNGQ